MRIRTNTTTMMTTNKAALVAATPLDRQLFLAQALAHGDALGKFSTEEADALYQNIAAIAHKLITMKTADLADESQLRTQVQNAFTLTSLGLEYGSQGNLDKAVRVLTRNRTVTFFQIGSTLTSPLLDRARNLLKKGTILPSLPGAPPGTSDIQIYNPAEQAFLEAVTKYQTTIRTSQVTIRDPVTSRNLSRVTDVEMVDRQLRCIENRWRYVRALPLDNVLKLTPPLSSFANPIEYLTLGLIVNLSLHRRIDFQLNAHTLADFNAIAYENGNILPPLRKRLLKWIADYLAEAKQPEAVQQYAVSYWDECLKLDSPKPMLL